MATEEADPDNGVVEAQLLVPRDVHAAIIDLTQGPQPQRRQRGNLHHQQGVTPEDEDDGSRGIGKERIEREGQGR